MKLELKREYLEWSIGCGGKTGKRKLKNIHPSEFTKLYNQGYTEFFTIVETKNRDILEPIKKVKKNDTVEPGGE